MIGQPGSHRRGFLQCHVLPAVVVEAEPQGQHRFVVLPFLAVGVCQAGEPTDAHPHGKVLSLDVGRGNAGILRAAHYRLLGYLRDHRRRIAALFFHAFGAVSLDELREVDLPAERFRDRKPVRGEAVRRNLEVSRRCPLQLVGKQGSVFAGSFSEMPCANEFRCPFDPDETVGIAHFVAVLLRNLGPLLAADKRPDFVRFDVIDRNVFEAVGEHPLAVFADVNHQ